jgi:pilus assembly protein CpaE
VSALAHKAVLVLEDNIDSGPIEQALPPGSRVTKTALPDAAYLWSSLTATAADVDLVVFACDREHDRVLEGITNLTRQLASRPALVVLHTGSSNGFMEQAFGAGADDLITLPQPTHELAFALEKAIARRRGATTQAQDSVMITVLGPKGGTGKTLTACNLAVALAESGHSPVIVDLDLQFGDVGLALGLRPDRTIYDLAVAGSSLDAEKVAGFLASHSSGAHALLAPVRPDQAAAITIPFLRAVFEALRSRHDVVIVDTPPAFTPEVIAAVDLSSDICLVGMLDALSLKDTKIGLDTLAQMGYEMAGVRLVLNRADSNVGISHADVARLLGRRPDVLVPSDRSIPRAITDGQTIVTADPRSGAARSFVALAASYANGKDAANGTEPEPAVAKRRRTLRRKEGR